MLKKFFIIGFSAVFFNACGDGGNNEIEPPAGSTVSDTGDVSLPDGAGKSSDNKSQQDETSDAEEPQSTPLPSIGSPSYSLVCTSEDNKTLTLKVLNYSSPFPACRVNVAAQCLCEFEITETGSDSPTIYYARNTRNFCDEIFKSAVSGESYTLGNGRTINFTSPAERGYTCPSATEEVTPPEDDGWVVDADVPPEETAPANEDPEESNEDGGEPEEEPPAESPSAGTPFNENLPVG